ncbi:insulinase family protein, partial [bacterium]|nr:insulinase family protein [candidate division CSSED10-310 bacterium]
MKEYLSKAAWDNEATFVFPESHGFLMENGLRVFVLERHDIPMVYARAQIRGGSIYDPVGKEGLAYLTGWVLTEGTESYSEETLDEVMDQRGAYVTSVAYNESCIATLNCLSADIVELFPYFAEILSKASFDDSSLQEGKNYIIGDLMRMNDDASELCYRRFRYDVFQNHPYAKPHKGNIESLISCTRDDVLNFYRKYYTPDQAVLVLVGDVSKSSVESLCEKYLSDWEKASESLPLINAPLQIVGRKITIVNKDTVQAQINIGHIGINRTNPDRFRIEVLNRILGGGGLYTRLAEEVRVKRGLTYGVYSFFAQREFTGEFAVSTFTKVESCGEAIEVILSELNRIRDELVTDDELWDAKQSLIGSFPLEFEDYEGIAQSLVHMYFYGL